MKSKIKKKRLSNGRFAALKHKQGTGDEQSGFWDFLEFQNEATKKEIFLHIQE